MRRLFILGLALAAQACTITIPTGIAGQPGKTPSPAPSGCAATFAQYDKNKDGAWSQEEFNEYFSTLPQTAVACLDPNDPTKTVTCPQHDPVVQFQRYDANGNGKLSASEFCAGPTVPPPSASPNKGPNPQGNECDDRFKRADADGNGKISLEEWSAADFREPPPPGVSRAAVMPTPEELKADFERRDTNQDGNLDHGELCGGNPNPKPTMLGTPDPKPTMLGTPVPAPDACTQDFQDFDTNQDGALSYDEYAKGKFSKIRFFRAPTPEEIQKMQAGFRDEATKLDTNQDQKLTLAEFKPSCQ